MVKPIDLGHEVLPGDIQINTMYYLQRINPSYTKVMPTQIRTYTLEKDHTFYEINFVGVDNNEVNFTSTNALPNGQYDEWSLLTNKLYSIRKQCWNSA